MGPEYIGVMIVLVLFLIVIGILYYIYRRIREKVRSFSKLAFGTASLTEGIRKMELEEQTTPKTVSAATSIYKPSIMRDFPEFHYDEMKARAENVLTSYLQSVNKADATLLTEGTNELKNQLQLKIDILRNNDKREHYDNIKIHRTEIHRYLKEKGRCTIIFQSAVEYVHYMEEYGTPILEQHKKMKQTKYNIEVVYIQNQEMVENLSDAGLAMNCPNCDAPLTKLGAKVCPYCDSPVIEFNIRVWNFNRVVEVR